MGCLQTKQKEKPNKFIKIKFGEKNNNWKLCLMKEKLNIILIENSNEVPQHPAFAQIQKDIGRTFPNQDYFKFQSGKNIFKQTLRCFALSFPKIGYTQGLNFIAGYILLHKFTKQQCLHLMSAIFTHPQMLFMGIYDSYFPLAYLNCNLFWKLLAKMDKQLFLWLKEIEIPDHMWIFQWFLTLFIYSFPIEFIAYFFDYIFHEKSFALVKLSYGIIQSLRDVVMNLEKDQLIFLLFLESLKNFDICVSFLSIITINKHCELVTPQLIQQSLNQLKSQTSNSNFYIKYFTSPSEKQKQTLYQLFINQIQQQNLELSKSKDKAILLETYKRNSNDIQILDEILIQSEKRQIDKNKSQYKSNMEAVIAESKIFKKSTFRPTWTSQIPVKPETTNSYMKIKDVEQQGTYSIVRKIDLNKLKSSAKITNGTKQK